jgi:hypothetical protein
MGAEEEGQKMRGRDQWPMLRLRGASWFAGMCERMARRATDQNGNCVLCVYLHPWEFVEMPERIHTDESTISFKPFLWRNTGDSTVKGLDDLIARLKDAGWQMRTLREVVSS